MSKWSPEFLEFKEENGLVIVSQKQSIQNNHERLFLLQIEELKPKAIFFRRFFREEQLQEEKPESYKSEPTVVIFSDEEVKHGSPEHEKIHSALWSTGQVDVYVLKGETDVSIFNCRKPKREESNSRIEPLFQQNNGPWKSLELASGAIEALDQNLYSPQVFGNGTFWEIEKEGMRPGEMDAPQIVLLNHLLSVRKQLIDARILADDLVDKLLLAGLLIKFLEEIKNTDGTSTLKAIYQELDVINFQEAVRNGQLFSVLDPLAKKFNGKIFDFDYSKEEKKVIELKTKSLQLFLEFLEGGKINPVTRQLFIWEQFNFTYLPTELVSSLYENFIQQEAKGEDGKGEKGIVYTPVFLVDFLVDESMPLDKPELLKDNVFKVLDPTCGSGVFLVAAYKRILEWWMLNNRNPADGSFPSLDPETAQQLMEQNIFGVDVKKKAVLISAFSLTTTFLKVLTPKQIWNELRFKNLEDNLIHAPSPEGFFGWAAKAKTDGRRFDLVLGNPPFNEEKGVKKDQILRPDLLKTIGVTHSIPKGKFAPHFFEASMQFADKVCMILPSNVMLYSKGSQSYRNELFTNYSVSQIWDFTHLREALFIKKGFFKGEKEKKTGRTPVIAMLAYSKPSDQHTPIVHTVVRRTQVSECKIRFEIDHYDRHLVPWNWAVSADKYFIWKTNLLGGGGLFSFIYRFSLLPKLDSISSFADVEPKRGFEGGQNFKKENVFQVVDIKDSTPKIESKEVVYSSDFKNEEIYSTPYFLVDQTIGDNNVPFALIQEEIRSNNESIKKIYFNRDFWGIKLKAENEDLYNYLETYFKSNPMFLNPQLFIYSISSSALISTESDINLGEIKKLPFPDSFEKLRLSDSERFIQNDILTYFRHLGKQISPGSSGENLFKRISHGYLRTFCSFLSILLNEIYVEDQNQWQPGQNLIREDCVICQIGYGPKGKMKTGVFETEPKNLKIMLEDEYRNRGAIYKRVIRLYDHQNGFDCIYLIKPNAMRYWLKSIALRDAGQIFIELRDNGF